jgi:hypothetical protein
MSVLLLRAIFGSVRARGHLVVRQYSHVQVLRLDAKTAMRKIME